MTSPTSSSATAPGAASPLAPVWISERTARWLLAACVLIGLVLRIVAAWKWNMGRPDSPARLVGDEPGYDGLARDIVDGFGMTWPGRTPFYPYWLGALRVIGRSSYDFITYVQAVAGTLAVPLTYLLGRRLFGAVPALFAALLVATNWVLIHQVVMLQTEVLYTPFVLWIALAMHEALIEEPGTPQAEKQFLWLGAAVGLSCLLRPTLVLFPAFVVLVVLVRDRSRRATRSALYCVVGAVLAVAPWSARNWMRYQEFLPLATSNAVLWQGSPEYYHLVRDSGYSYMDVWTKVIFNRSDAMPDPGGIVGERAWRERAVRSIRREPAIYLRYSAEKAVTFWVGDPEADWAGSFPFDPRVFRAWGASWRITLHGMVARMLIFPALVALYVLRRRWRELLPITSLLAYFTALHAATAAVARLSDPLQPLLHVVIAGALAQLAWAHATRSWRGGRVSHSAA